MALEIEAGQSFIIYGAGMLGRIMQANLLEQGMRVECFLDRCAGPMREVEGIPVFTPSDPQLSSVQKKHPVILAVSDYFAHEALAETLVKHGFTLLILKRDLIGGEQRHAVNALYDHIFEGMSLTGMHIETYRPATAQRLPHQIPLREENGSITAYVPVSLLFRSPTRAWKHSPERRVLRDTSPEPSQHWTLEDYPFYLNDTLCTLFESLRDGRGVQIAAVARHNLQLRARILQTDSVQAGEMAARYVDHFQHMTRALSLDPGFFSRHPVQIRWHEHGYFYILDGNTRLAFLYTQGHTHVPCRMRIEDYRQWLEAPGLGDVHDHLQTHADLRVPTPIPHADFYSLPVLHESARRTAFESVLAFLVAERCTLSGKRFVDLRAGAGHFAQGFHRLGAEVTALEPDTAMFGLLRRLNVSLRCAEIHALEADWRRSVLPGYDCVVLIDCVAPSQRLSEGDIQQLDKATGRYLFYEACGSDEVESIRAHSTFDDYRVLHEAVRFGAVRYLIVFMRGKPARETRETP